MKMIRKNAEFIGHTPYYGATPRPEMEAKNAILSILYFLILTYAFYCALDGIKKKGIRIFLSVVLFVLTNAAIVFLVASAAILD